MCPPGVGLPPGSQGPHCQAQPHGSSLQGWTPDPLRYVLAFAPNSWGLTWLVWSISVAICTLLFVFNRGLNAKANVTGWKRFGDKLGFLGSSKLWKEWTHQPSASITEASHHLGKLFRDGNFEEKLYPKIQRDLPDNQGAYTGTGMTLLHLEPSPDSVTSSLLR